jgi:hypothetical protein
LERLLLANQRLDAMLEVQSSSTERHGSSRGLAPRRPEQKLSPQAGEREPSYVSPEKEGTMSNKTHWTESGSSPPLDAVARTLSIEELPDFLASLARANAIATLRLAAPQAPAPTEPADRLLTAGEAAPLLGLTPDELKRRRSLPFRRCIGRRTVRYSERGIARYLRRAS